jgi:hypothetical protein
MHPGQGALFLDHLAAGEGFDGRQQQAEVSLPRTDGIRIGCCIYQHPIN